MYENKAYLTKCKKLYFYFILFYCFVVETKKSTLGRLNAFHGLLFVHLQYNVVKHRWPSGEMRLHVAPLRTKRALACLSLKDLYQSLCLQYLHSCPLPTASTHMCAQASQEGGKFILHKQFALWPLFERASQVANSDVDTCPFGTGMKTATHFLETIKHPVSEQQLCVNCNLG